MPRMLVDRIDRASVFGMSLPKQKMLGRGATSVVFDHPTDPNLVIIFSLDDFKFQWLMHLGLCSNYEWNATGFFTTKPLAMSYKKPERVAHDIYVGLVKRLTKLQRGTEPYRRALREARASDKLWMGMPRPGYPGKWSHAQENWEFWTRILDQGPVKWPTLFTLADYIINENGSDVHPDAFAQNWMLDGDNLIPVDAAISQYALDFIWS